MSLSGIEEETRVEVQAIGYELVRHDTWEMATYDALDAALEQAIDYVDEGYTVDAQDLLRRARNTLTALRRRDIEHENPRHRQIATAYRQRERAG